MRRRRDEEEKEESWKDSAGRTDKGRKKAYLQADPQSRRGMVQSDKDRPTDDSIRHVSATGQSLGESVDSKRDRE